MTRTSVVGFSLGLILLWTGCVSYKGAVVFDQKDPIALVSVISNADINWKGEEPIDFKSAGFLFNKAPKEDSDITYITGADELIDTAEMTFWNAMTESPLINLAEKETVLNSSAYRNASVRKNYGKNKAINATGYRFVDYRDKNFSRALAGETGIQRSMFVEFNFTKAMTSGFGKNGKGRAEVTMLVIVNNAQGKAVYRNSFSSWSSSTLKVSGGDYSQSELLALFEPVIKNLCKEFLGRQ